MHEGTMPESTTAIYLLLFSGMAIYWLIPLTAWYMLRGQNDRLSNLWFTGATLYAVTVTLFIGGSALPPWIAGPFTATLSLAAVLCFFEALRQELSPAQAPKRLYFGLLGLQLFLLLAILEAGRFHDLGRVLSVIALAVVDAGVAFWGGRVAKQRRSRALWIVVVVFSLFALVNFLRACEYLLWGRFSELLSLTPMGNIGLVMNYLAGIFYCYGYWGFVLEKNRIRLVEATRSVADAQARQQMSERIAAITQAAQTGAMSAAVTHEISQPLTAIRLNVEHLERVAGQMPSAEALRPALDQVARDVRRVVDIIHSMRRLIARDPGAEVVLQDPDRVVNAALAHLRGQLDEAQVRIELSLAGPTQARMPAGELEQVLLNLIRNALEAMAMARTPFPVLRISTWHSDGQFHLSCADNGPGVSQAHAQSIFEMQFSTKPGNMGMGLWLSAYIVERRGGRLRLDATEGPGARFLMTVPVA